MQRLTAVDGQHYSTFRLPAVLRQVDLIEQLDELVGLTYQQSPLVLGEGSNSIFLTDMQRPVVRILANQRQVTDEGDTVLLTVEAGHNWHELVSYCVAQGWWGLENLALIPGSVGAAPVQNIGAYGVEFTDVCAFVDFFDWQQQRMIRLSQADCQFGYRDSVFKRQLADRGIICRVGLRLQKHGQPKLSYKGLDHLPASAPVLTVYQAVIAVRQSKLPDPRQLANCGSFFKNPLITHAHYQQLKQQFPTLPCYPQPDGQIKTAAAFLIEQCGFKGQQSGGIGCYALQPLVLFNDGSGTAAALQQWVGQVIAAVQDKFAVMLEPEVRMLSD